MTLSKDAARERLSEGDIVYFVEGENEVGKGDLTVKKGTVHQYDGRKYPVLLLWDQFDSEPSGASVTRSPREVFTEAEVIGQIEHDDPSLLATSAQVDELLSDPITSREVVPILGGAVIQRLADDELAHPGDPEA